MKRFILFLSMLLILACPAFAAEQLYVNNVKTTLAADINDSVTSLTLTSATGFPSPTGGDWFMMMLVQNDGDIEIVKCTARSGVTCTIVRAQESTSALSHTASPATAIIIALTAGTLDRFEDGLHELLPGDGTAADPSHSFASDPDTGLYNAAANSLGFTIGGTGQMKLVDGILQPITDSDVDLGLTGTRFKTGYFDEISATSQLSFMAYKSAADQTLTTEDTEYLVTFDAEDHDTGSWYNASTGKATVPAGKGGVYLIIACLYITSPSVDNYIWAYLYVDGGTPTRKAMCITKWYGITSLTMPITKVMTLAAGDVFYIQAVNTTANGGLVKADTDGRQTYFSAIKLF